MSYDLMVFDPAVAPHDRPAFVAWYERQSDLLEERASDDPSHTSPPLRAWFEAMRHEFRNINGPGAPSVEELMKPEIGDRLADYTFGHHVIYIAFPWSAAEEAYPVVRNLAVKYGVGFYDVSGDAENQEIHFPGQPLAPESDGAWRQISRQFKEMKEQ